MASPKTDVKYRTTIHYQDRQARFYSEDLGNNIALKMVEIPPGTFLMGSPDSKEERRDSEGPQHEVRLSGFFMGMYPITQAQWKAVAALPKDKIDLNPSPSEFEGANRPVEQVSWHEAMEFCSRLSQHTTRQYRLPTEAEWEYACRAGTTTPFHFGDTITTDLANYDGNYTYSHGPEGKYREETTEVGYFNVANAFGLFDMHGNVWEWCLDHWHDSYTEKPEKLKENGNLPWLSSNESASRLLRGGSWIDHPRHCRSAFRYDYNPDSRDDNVGFRVVSEAARALL